MLSVNVSTELYSRKLCMYYLNRTINIQDFPQPCNYWLIEDAYVDNEHDHNQISINQNAYRWVNHTFRHENDPWTQMVKEQFCNEIKTFYSIKIVRQII